MIAYCTASETIAEFPIFPQTSAVQRFTETSALISAKITRAEATINSYVGRRYAVPFTTIPPKINEIAVNLTAYYALVAKFTKDNHNTNDWVEKLGKDAVDELTLIRDRKIDLVDSNGAVIAERTSGTRIVSNTQDYQPFSDVDPITSWKTADARLASIDRNG